MRNSQTFISDTCVCRANKCKLNVTVNGPTVLNSVMLRGNFENMTSQNTASLISLR